MTFSIKFNKNPFDILIYLKLVDITNDPKAANFNCFSQCCSYLPNSTAVPCCEYHEDLFIWWHNFPGYIEMLENTFEQITHCALPLLVFVTCKCK